VHKHTSEGQAAKYLEREKNF
jgi:hypothetical protein